MNDSSATLPLTLYVALSLCPVTLVGLSLIYYLSVCHLYAICRSVTHTLSAALPLARYLTLCASNRSDTRTACRSNGHSDTERSRASQHTRVSHAVQSVMRFSLSHCSISHAVQSVTPFNQSRRPTGTQNTGVTRSGCSTGGVPMRSLDSR
jgi:hypothetical protein